jgi:uncharacterized protein (DUF305 family)
MIKTGIAAGGAAALTALAVFAGAASGMLPLPGIVTPAGGSAMGFDRGWEGMGHRGSADAMFAVQMVPHHESAVEMSREALARAGHPEVVRLAEAIIRTQTAEIDQLRAAAERLGADAEERSRMGMGMAAGYDLAQVPAGSAFDRAFLEAMITHHQMGVHMAEMVQRHGSDAEIRTLAEGMVTAQTAEIDLMQNWLDQWY